MKHLKDIREAHDISQQRLAVAAGLSVSAIQKIESGREPTVTTLRAIAHGLTELGRPTTAADLLEDVSA